MTTNLSAVLSRGALRQPAKRHLLFVFLWLLSVLWLRAPLGALISLALEDERYSHILFIPIISVFLAWLRRSRIFRECRYCPNLGVPLLLAGILFVAAPRMWPSFISPDQNLATTVFGILVAWAGLFTWCYGLGAVRGSLFPLFFLLLMVPIPSVLLDKAVAFLQTGSAEMSHGLFKLIGMPVFREGFRFSLPGVDIEIAEECSGIRSSQSLFISSILVAHLFLRSRWRMFGFVLLTIPIVIFKNAVRIVTLSWLGVYVDHEWLVGNLHHRGGFLFSIPGLAIMALVFFALYDSASLPNRTRQPRTR